MHKYPLITAILLITACSQQPTTITTPGQINVAFMAEEPLEKAPASDNGIQHIWITLSDFMVSTNGDAWIHMMIPQRVDLIELAKGFTVPMKMSPIDPGHYTHIAIYLDNTSTITVNGIDYPLITPSNKIELINNWSVASGEQTDLCLAFNVFRAVHFAPDTGYILHPTYKVVKCFPGPQG